MMVKSGAMLPVERYPMNAILEAENAYRAAEDELKARRDQASDRSANVTLGFAISGIGLLIASVLLGIFLSWGHASTGILLMVGTFLLSFVPFRMHQARVFPKRLDESALDAAFDELEEAQKRWLQSAGFELTEDTLEELGFDYLPDRDMDDTYGSAQLLHRESGKVIPVVLKWEISRGYALYGPEGLIAQEYPVKETV